jgi:hypothetical protein
MCDPAMAYLYCSATLGLVSSAVLSLMPTSSWIMACIVHTATCMHTCAHDQHSIVHANGGLRTTVTCILTLITSVECTVAACNLQAQTPNEHTSAFGAKTCGV